MPIPARPVARIAMAALSLAVIVITTTFLLWPRPAEDAPAQSGVDRVPTRRVQHRRASPREDDTATVSPRDDDDRTAIGGPTAASDQEGLAAEPAEALPHYLHEHFPQASLRERQAMPIASVDELGDLPPAIGLQASAALEEGAELSREQALIDSPYHQRPIATDSLLASRPGEAPRVLYRQSMVADRVLVRVQPDADANQLAALAARHDARIERPLRTASGDVYAVHLQRRGVEAVRRAVASFRREAATIAVAEPDGIVHATITPDDPDLGNCWGLHNTGQDGGTADADIDAPEAWDITTGSHDVVVAVIDTGVDYTHPDLAANMWTNPGEIPDNDIDDDGNGFIDDVHGYDFANGDGDPKDDHFHGTHCAGTIAAVGDNGIGVTGVAWQARIMALKFLTGGGSGTLSAAVESLDYATANGAHLSSNSWGGSGFSQLLYDSILANARPFVAAAGNSAADNDATPHYPSSYDCDNVIAVAASDRNDALSSFSCYGLEAVDLAAPGTDIYSTYPSYETAAIVERGENTYYETISGTSMATPHVAGACVLLMSEFQDWNAVQLRQFLMATVDPIAALDGVIASGGRLNVHNALVALDNPLVIAGHPTVTINDEIDSNGIVQPGETVSVILPIANVGSVDSGPVSVELTSSDGSVALSPEVFNVTSIAGQDVVTAAPFTISLPADLNTPHEVAAALEVRSDGALLAEVPIVFTVYTLRTVTGVIWNRDTDEPVPGTLIRGYGAVQTSCYSDGDGSYRLPVVDAGAVTIVASKREWFPASARIGAQDSTVPRMEIFPVDFVVYQQRLETINDYGHAGTLSFVEHCDGRREGVSTMRMNNFSEGTRTNLAYNFYADECTYMMGYYPDLEGPEWIYQVTEAGEIIGYQGIGDDSKPWIWSFPEGGRLALDIDGKLAHRRADGTMYGGKYMGGGVTRPWRRNAAGDDTVYDLPAGNATGFFRCVSSDGQQLCGRMFRTKDEVGGDKGAFRGTPDGPLTDLGWLPSHPEDSGRNATQDAMAINNAGVVAGWVWQEEYVAHTSVATVHLGDCWIDLNDILPEGMPVRLRAATGINDAMEISCTALYEYRDTIWFTEEIGVKIVPEVVPDRAPVASAGHDVRVPADTTVALHGKVGDDGEPQYLWQQVAGPSVTIADPLSRITEATLGDAGTYVFRFTVDDGVNDPVSDEMTVVVYQDGNAAPSISITNPADGWRTSERTYSRAATLDVHFDVADSDGSIARVELLINGVVAGCAAWDDSLDIPAWRFVHGIHDGVYTLVGRAWDDDGASTDSAPVQVTCSTGEKVTIEILHPTGDDVQLDYNEDFVFRYRLSGGDGHTMSHSFRMDGMIVEYPVSQTEKDVIYEYNWGQIGTGPHVLRFDVHDRWDDANGDMHRRMLQEFVRFEIVQPAQIADPVALAPAMVDEEYSLPFTGVGNLERTWRFISGAVPPGMVFDTESGIYTGIPTEVGAYTFTIGIQNDHGSATRTYTHEVHREHPRAIRIINTETTWEVLPQDGLPVKIIDDHDVFEQLDATRDHDLTPAGPQGAG